MKHTILFLFCLLIFLACKSSNVLVNSNSNLANQSITVQSNSTKQEAISPDGKFFESLTADSSYFDVVKLVGTPDAETTIAEDKLPVPMILVFYKQNFSVLFVNKGKPQEKGIKSNYKYFGTLKVQPSEILHSAKPEYLDLLEVVRTVVVKKLLENARKEMRQKRK